MSTDRKYFLFIVAVAAVTIFLTVMTRKEAIREDQHRINLYDTNPREFCRQYGRNDMRCMGVATQGR